MSFPERTEVDRLIADWADKRVRVRPGSRPDLARFEAVVGRVVTVNYGGRAVVDFGDGGWYDVADFPAVLEEVTDPAEASRYAGGVNSAQPFPGRQG